MANTKVEHGQHSREIRRVDFLRLGGASIAAASIAASCSFPLYMGGMRSAHGQKGRPNIILIVADDMAKRDLRVMPQTRRLIAEEGVSFENAFTSCSICGVSRATILRGQYAHNHGVLANHRPYGEESFRGAGHDGSTVATWLQDAGYRTALVGKYINGYEGTYVPPGWDYWDVFEGNFYSNFRMNRNGSIVDLDDKLVKDDVVSIRARNFVGRSSQGEEPYFLMVGNHAPHNDGRKPYDIPRRHASKFPRAKAPRTPSFNELDRSDKPAWLRRLPRYRIPDARAIDIDFRDRSRSLQTLDDMVKWLFDEVERQGQLDNTYFIFTSDNGWHYGAHRWKSKWTPYEEAVLTPLLIRGPDLPRGRTEEKFVVNTDLAPTLADLAGVEAPDFVDGRSLAPILAGDPVESWRDAVLLENFRVSVDARFVSPTPSYSGVRTANHKYVGYATGEEELYRLEEDPHEMESAHEDADPETLSSLRARVEALRDCSGESCRIAEDAST